MFLDFFRYYFLELIKKNRCNEKCDITFYTMPYQMFVLSKSIKIILKDLKSSKIKGK